MKKLIENLNRLRETREKEIFWERIFKILSILVLNLRLLRSLNYLLQEKRITIIVCLINWKNIIAVI